MEQYETLLQTLDIFIANKHWPELKPSEIFKIIMYVHSKGFLYTPMVDGKIQCVICAYRIPEVNDITIMKLPLKEEGTILYVPFFISFNKEENLFKIVRESLSLYLENNPDITELVVEDKNKKIKKYYLKGANNAKQEDGFASNTNISDRSDISAGISGT